MCPGTFFQPVPRTLPHHSMWRWSFGLRKSSLGIWYWGKRPLPRWALWSENHISKLHISLTQTLKKCKHITSINVVQNVSCCLACNKSIRNEAIPECSLAISLGASENFFPCLQIYIMPQRFSHLFCLADAAHYYFPPFSLEERAPVGKFL